MDRNQSGLNLCRFELKLYNDVLNETILFNICYSFLHVEHPRVDYSRSYGQFRYSWQIFKLDFLENEGFDEEILFFPFIISYWTPCISTDLLVWRHFYSFFHW